MLNCSFFAALLLPSGPPSPRLIPASVPFSTPGNVTSDGGRGWLSSRDLLLIRSYSFVCIINTIWLTESFWSTATHGKSPRCCCCRTSALLASNPSPELVKDLPQPEERLKECVCCVYPSFIGTIDGEDNCITTCYSMVMWNNCFNCPSLWGLCVGVSYNLGKSEFLSIVHSSHSGLRFSCEIPDMSPFPCELNKSMNPPASLLFKSKGQLQIELSAVVVRFEWQITSPRGSPRLADCRIAFRLPPGRGRGRGALIREEDSFEVLEMRFGSNYSVSWLDLCVGGTRRIMMIWLGQMNVNCVLTCHNSREIHVGGDRVTAGR